MPILTPKQEGFCLSYIETGNASEPHTTWYNFNHPTHLRFGLSQSEYNDEPDFSSMYSKD